MPGNALGIGNTQYQVAALMSFLSGLFKLAEPMIPQNIVHEFREEPAKRPPYYLLSR
jgi:hypothetical protein